MKAVWQRLKKVNKYEALLLLIIFCIFQYGIQKICGFTLFPDEFGYWASAAHALHYDWSEVAGMGSYYSFGYSLILIPVMMLFSDGVMAYRAAVFVNMALLCIGLFLLRDMLMKIASAVSEKQLLAETAEGLKGMKNRSVFLAGIAVLYPAWIFYMQMTLVEALLLFLFVCVSWLLVRFLEKPDMGYGAALAAVLIYLYCVHMRTVGVVIACSMVMALYAIARPESRKAFLVFLGVLLLAAAAAYLWKQNTIANVYANADEKVLAVNNYSGQLGKLRMIVTFQGMKRFVLEFAGKVFYLGQASFGLFYWGVLWCLKGIKRGGKIRFTAIFLLLATLLELSVSTIFMYRSSNIDSLIYGRYTDFLLPVFMAIGLIAMWESRFLLRASLLLGAASGVCIPALLSLIEFDQREGMRGYMAVGISYLLDEKNFNVYQYFRNVWLLGFGLLMVTALVVWISRRSENFIWFLTVILLMEVLLGLQTGHHYTYQVNDANFIDRKIADTLKEKAEETDRIVYLDEGAPEFVDFLQMQIRDRPIQVLDMKGKVSERGEGLLEQADFVITYSETSFSEELEEKYEKKQEGNTFLLFYE